MFELRLYQKGDEIGIIECVKNEYQDTYFKQWFYDKRSIEKSVADGNVIFLIAENNVDFNKKEIAGIMIVKDMNCGNTCELASLIIKKKYRGYGLGTALTQYAIETAKSRLYSSALCLPVLFHTATQKIFHEYGFIDTGMILNVFDLEVITHSYDNGKNIKHSQGVQLLPLEKKNVGILFIPSEIKAFVKNIYNRLKVTYEIVTERQDVLFSVSKLSCETNEKQHSVMLKVEIIGRDIVYRVNDVLSEKTFSDNWTANILINMKNSGAIWVYEKFREKGWFCTGMIPLQGRKEYLILHYPGKVISVFDDYKLTPELREIAEWIGKEVNKE